MGDRLVTIDMGPKIGCPVPHWGDLALHLTQRGLGVGLPP